MKDSLSALCALFIENRNAIKAAFPWESSYIWPVCAAIYADKRRRADTARMKECRTQIKSQTGVFSNFRSTAKLPLIAMLAVEDRPEELLSHTLDLYKLLKTHFMGSQYLPLTAAVLASLTEPKRYDETAARTRTVYNMMKESHPFLTSGEDSVFAALLALSDMSDEQIVRKAERCYELLKPSFFSGNAVQSLSHVLALGEGTAEETCDRTMALYDMLKSRGRKYGTDYELATLGVLALLPGELSVIADDLLAADAYLAAQSGYGFFGVGKKQRLMHAGMLLASERIGDDERLTMTSAAVGGTIALIAAQQAAMCAAIAASAAASSSASS